MSLIWRLIISYIIIIAVTLALAFATLVVIARPVQSRLARFRLTAESRQAAQLINSLYRQGVATSDIARRINTLADENRLHLLLLDTQGAVLADSRGDWMGQQLPLSTDSDSWLRLADVDTFTALDGETYMFAAIPIGTAGERSGYVASVAPRALGLPAVVAELGWGFIIAGGIALLVSLLLGVLVARSIALPLKQIAAGAAAVARGDYEHRLPEQGPPEVKRVAASFNVMIGRVEDSQQAMRDFVSNVSHELKTPLTSIQGFSQAIMEGATPDEAARRRAAGIIHQEAGRMARLVEELLDLARLDSGQVVMQKAHLNLAQILAGTLERLRPQAAEKQVQLFKQWDTLPLVTGDGDRLAQVFTNLLDNAIKHTPAGGRVSLTGRVVEGLPRPRRVRAGLVRPDATTAVSERGNFVEISVADTGPGIPPADLARIFERFYQVDKSRKRGQGAGLGLAITKEIVEAHGGAIRAESLEGVGTKFTVLLPITEADTATLISSKR
jgi:signal transduction histidine kinase